MRRRLDPALLRAALWAFLALRRTRHALRRERLSDVAVRPPPRLPVRARRGLDAVLRRWDPTCLERALVLQAWERAHEGPRDVVIGVRGSGETLTAHAWLEGESNQGSYEELMRVPAR